MSDAEIRKMYGGRRSKSWTLMDGVALNREHPTTFEIPTWDERVSQNVGASVKLGFVPDEKDLPSERMWVKVAQRIGGRYIGTLDNDPVCLGANPGDPIEFGPENILSIWE